MKKIIIIGLLLGLLLPLFSSGQGITFREIPIEEALKLAAKEKKMVFIDFYTTWCGPCKQLSNNVFPQKEVGDYFNSNFISLKCDAEKGDGPNLARKYNVKAYPTLVFLNEKGDLIYSFAGALDASSLIERVQRGLNPALSAEKLKDRYERGERTPELIYYYAITLFENGNNDEAYTVINDYFQNLSERRKSNAENFKIYERYILNLDNPIAQYVLKNYKKFFKTVGIERTQKLLRSWLWQKTMPYIIARDNKTLTTEEFQWIRQQVTTTGLNTGSYPYMLQLGDYKLKGQWDQYLNFCQEKFPEFNDKEKFLILVNLEDLVKNNEQLREKAIRLIEDNITSLNAQQQTPLRLLLKRLKGENNYRLQVDLENIKSGIAVLSGFKNKQYVRDSFPFDNYRAIINIPALDTTQYSLRVVNPELKSPTAKLGDYYPTFNIMLVPGGFLQISVKLEKGKIPQVKYIKGDKVSKDFTLLEHELPEADELTYKQLIVDNIIEGGDIRNYPDELSRNTEAVKRKTTSFIREHPDSYIALIELYKYYNWFDENEIEKLFNQMPAVLQNNAYGQAINARLERGRRFRSGATAADFSKKDLNGEIITLSQWKGKYVLLDFWGSWCGPCRASHPHLKELYQKYKDKLVFISVADEQTKDIEKARASWRKAIQEDGLTWIQILNNEDKEKYNITALYNVSSFPTKILIGPDGKIIARWSGSSSSPDDKLKEIFGY